MRRPFTSTATVSRRSNNAESTASSDRNVWFSPGAFASGSPGVHGGLANYKPRAGGPLEASGDCDPDDDGIPGADWNGDGAQETRWVDLAGSAVDCTEGGATLAEGAIQKASAVPVCGNGLSVGQACDDADPCTTADVCNASATCVGIAVPIPSEVATASASIEVALLAVLNWNSPNATTSTCSEARSAGCRWPGGETRPASGTTLESSRSRTRPPHANSGCWYLIRGANACAGNGPYGFAGVRGAQERCEGPPVVPDRAPDRCPSSSRPPHTTAFLRG